MSTTHSCRQMLCTQCRMEGPEFLIRHHKLDRVIKQQQQALPINRAPFSTSLHRWQILRFLHSLIRAPHLLAFSKQIRIRPTTNSSFKRLREIDLNKILKCIYNFHFSLNFIRTFAVKFCPIIIKKSLVFYN